MCSKLIELPTKQRKKVSSDVLVRLGEKMLRMNESDARNRLRPFVREFVRIKAGKGCEGLLLMILKPTIFSCKARESKAIVELAKDEGKLERQLQFFAYVFACACYLLPTPKVAPTISMMLKTHTRHFLRQWLASICSSCSLPQTS